MSPSRLLFVDFAPMPGGSVQSLLLLLRHLPRERFHATLLLSPGVAALPEVAALDLPVVAYDAGQGTAIPFRAGTARIRRSRAATGWRELSWLGSVWRWGSIARRLWLRTRHTAAFIAGLIQWEGIDLVHLNDALPLAEPGILAAWRTRRPSLVLVRSFTPLDSFHRLISRLPAAGVFTSAPLLQDQRRQGARFRRERIIANAIDLAAYAGPARRREVRAEFGLPADARIAVAVGRLMQRKGLDVFLQALAATCNEHPALYGLIVGGADPAEPGLGEALAALAASLGVSDRVRFSGFRHDIPRLLLAADLLSFVPNEAEPFGRTVIEGMAAGLPVIGARSGAIPDIVLANETGLLVPPADPAALATAMQDLLADPARAAAMGAAGRARAAAHYSIERQTEQLCELYTSLLPLSSPAS